MRSITLSYVFLLSQLSPSFTSQEFNKQQATLEAKVTVQAFATAVKSELIAAMQAGGPTNAVDVCNIKAMPITERVAEDKSALVSRVSLKNRNPDKAPNDWQKVVLEDFDTRAANGEDIAPMASVSVVDVDGEKQMRFMKAIPATKRI